MRYQTKVPSNTVQKKTTSIITNHSITSGKLAGLVKKVENVSTMNAIVMTTLNT